MGGLGWQHSSVSREQIIQHFPNVVSLCPNSQFFPFSSAPTAYLPPHAYNLYQMAGPQVPKDTAVSKQDSVITTSPAFCGRKCPPQKWCVYPRVVAVMHVPSSRGKAFHSPLLAPCQGPRCFFKDCFPTIYRLSVSTQENETLMTAVVATVLTGFIKGRRGQSWQLTLVWGSCSALLWPMILRHHRGLAVHTLLEFAEVTALLCR